MSPPLLFMHVLVLRCLSTSRILISFFNEIRECHWLVSSVFSSLKGYSIVLAKAVFDHLFFNFSTVHLLVSSFLWIKPVYLTNTGPLAWLQTTFCSSSESQCIIVGYPIQMELAILQTQLTRLIFFSVSHVIGRYFQIVARKL